MAYLSSFLNIIEVALGLGFVIFIHELGHFALAKWNGVKVEKFSIGFGKTIVGFTRGETEYVLAVIPLGGFVKMLGENHEEEASKSTDPRAYPNKSVGARMAIISAGVIMNLILGMVCFVYAYGKGRDAYATKIGVVLPGSASYEAGLKAGDDIVSIDGRPIRSFDGMIQRVRLSSSGQVLHMELKRPGQEPLVKVNIEPKRETNSDHPTIGVAQDRSLILARPPLAVPPGMIGDPKTTSASPKLLRNDKVVAVGPVGSEPTPVADVHEYYRVVSKSLDKPLNVVVERPKPTKEMEIASTDETESTQRLTAVLPPNRFVDFGFRFRIRPLLSVLKGSIAEKAGFRKGDLIVKVNGDADFDPLQLPSIVFQNAGKPMTFEVRRDEADAKTPPDVLTVTPDGSPAWSSATILLGPVDLQGLGTVYQVQTKVESIRPGSPAAKAGFKVGDQIDSITFPVIPGDEDATKPQTIDLGDDSLKWAVAFQLIQTRELSAVELTRNGIADKIKIVPEPVDGWYNPKRGEEFSLLVVKGMPVDALTALTLGFEDTVDNVLSIYAMLRSLAQGRVSHRGLGGPILIANVAYEHAASGFTELVHFLGFLSINLAVLNFLPIPPLDGGQMVFLIAEKVRGRPLPDTALIAGTYIGLVLVLSLMVFVFFQDIVRYVTFL